MDDTQPGFGRDDAPLLRHIPAVGVARGSVLLLPALGVPAAKYQRCASLLGEAGFDVGLLEWRGVGDSPERAARNCDFGFRELLDEEIPRALRALSEAAPGQPLYILGHSLGGHLAAITAGRVGELIDGLILVACGSPSLDAFPPPTRRRIRALCALIPPCNRLLGYFPGNRLGFGGRQPRRLMRDWRHLALSGRYAAEGIDEDLEAGIGDFRGPVLSLRMADDDFAPPAAVRAVTRRFTHATVAETTLDADALGTAADHFHWARRPEAVVARIAAWCDARQPGYAT